MPLRLSLVALLLVSASAVAQPPKLVAPTSADPRLVVELFAAAPDIVQPIATDFDAKGRLLVVESHTHFRPAKYDGPKADRVRVLEDTDGDGKADKFTTFFEGTTFTMDLAVHPDGSVYVATRNELLRLRDTNNDGVADEKTRLVFLDTKGNYPHNGLCGLSFDSRGDVTLGMGENLGEPYKLVGADGTTLTGGGEGGNVYHMTADGKKLRRVATGFWNPFGSCRDIFGRLFVVDNDPDASPPCRLLHVVEGGDYGFQFRYGRAGRHPFQAWNGELPGTLPMVAGTGESPCEVISYESDGLPDEYRGDLLVPAWADHRLERYTLKPKGASFTADRKPFIQGTKDFYPSGLTVAPDGSLFVTDWGSRSYELHGKGAVWRVRLKDAKPVNRPAEPKEAILSPDRKTREAAAGELAKTDAGRELLRKQVASKDVRVRAAALAALVEVDRKFDYEAVAKGDPEPGARAMAVRALVELGDDLEGIAAGQSPGVVADSVRGWSFEALDKVLPPALADQDPHLRHAFIRVLSGSPGLLDKTTKKPTADVRACVGLLLAWRMSGRTDSHERLPDFLSDPDADVRFLAIKWVSDEKLTAFRPQLVEMLKKPDLDPRTFVGVSTALARLDDKPVNENSLAAYFLERVNDGDAPSSSRLMALRAIPAAHPKLTTELLTDLLRVQDAAFRVEVLRALKDRADPKGVPAVREILLNKRQHYAVRAQALVTLAASQDADAVNLSIDLAADPDGAVRREAVRSLSQAKLTAAQQERLSGILEGKDDSADLLNRVRGKPIHTGRPAATDTATWLKYLDGPADPDAGRRVFEHPKLAAGCFRCHRVEGRGADVGPDLSLIGRTERKWIVESILQPSAVVAPHFTAWQIQTLDERILVGQLVHTQLDESTYVDAKGNRFKVLANDVANTSMSKASIMPDGLLDGLTDQEIRDLVAYLASRK